MRMTKTFATRPQPSFTPGFAKVGLLACLLLTAQGCQTMGLPKFQMPRMTEVDGAKVEDPWTTQAGMEGRAGRSVEKEADPLNLRRFFLSEKAMEIERNCGLE
jgi:hypothetical protein